VRDDHGLVDSLSSNYSVLSGDCPTSRDITPPHTFVKELDERVFSVESGVRPEGIRAVLSHCGTDPGDGVWERPICVLSRVGVQGMPMVFPALREAVSQGRLRYPDSLSLIA